MADNRIAALRASNEALKNVVPLLRKEDVNVEQLRQALVETVGATVHLMDWAISTEEQNR